mmetsp:Transcript_16263/g.18092  ORF Transcript_16263/g.18092 Transcript_16263/m.18092 type:complete len:137 (+) Transcript_16263:80-490(+)
MARQVSFERCYNHFKVDKENKHDSSLLIHRFDITPMFSLWQNGEAHSTVECEEFTEHITAYKRLVKKLVALTKTRSLALHYHTKTDTVTLQINDTSVHRVDNPRLPKLHRIPIKRTRMKPKTKRVNTMRVRYLLNT